MWVVVIPPVDKYAGVAELADALDLGSSVERRKGSSPFARTKGEKQLDSYI